jgi:hypothetical protein
MSPTRREATAKETQKRRRNTKRELAKPDMVFWRDGQMKTRTVHPKPSQADVSVLHRFFAEVAFAIETVNFLDEARKGPPETMSALYEELYNFHVAALASIARQLFRNRHPFKRWSINREALQWAVAARKLRDSLPSLGEKATHEGDEVLAKIGQFVMAPVEKMRAVVYEPDPEGAADLKPSDPRMTVQFLLRTGYGPQRAALRAVSKLTGVPESTVADRLRRVFFFKPGEKGDPSR